MLTSFRYTQFSNCVDCACNKVTSTNDYMQTFILYYQHILFYMNGYSSIWWTYKYVYQIKIRNTEIINFVPNITRSEITQVIDLSAYTRVWNGTSYSKLLIYTYLILFIKTLSWWKSFFVSTSQVWFYLNLILCFVIRVPTNNSKMF